MYKSFQRVQAEIDRLRATGVILSTNVELRLDGAPRSDRRAPADPGACLYFKLNGKPHAMPCDKWSRVEDNVAAIAKHIEAIRGMERWGVGDVAQMFAGFAALPAPTPVEPWYSVLGVAPDAPEEVVQAAYRTLARKAHPDAGGSTEAMARLNVARDSYEASKADAA